MLEAFPYWARGHYQTARRVAAETRPDGRGGYLITLPRGVLDGLKAMRGPGESYSDVILRLARGRQASGNIRVLIACQIVCRQLS